MAENSRDTAAGAGWDAPGLNLQEMLPSALQNAGPFNWLRLKTLTGPARNDPLARLLGDPSHELRQAWLRQLWMGREPDLTIDRTDLPEPSFLIMGDTGEGDISQYAAVSILDAVGRDSDFMVLCSDVIYPAGGYLEYAYKLSWPYRNYQAPIYAVPGNHDWYDGLAGYMRYFCGQQQVPPPPRQSALSRAGILARLWKTPPDIADAARSQMIDTHRSSESQRVRLPGPYYRIQTRALDLIAIDTGIDGGIDAQQGAWLESVSHSKRSKILLTGKPIYANGKYRPCPIDDGRLGTVDDIIRNPECRYIAAIGGDTHNYQRYPVTVGHRVIQYIVSGGGGAFMHPTHRIPNIDTTKLTGVTEADFRCYPLRGDSLSIYSRLYDQKLPGSWYVTPAEAGAYMADRLGIAPVRAEYIGLTTTPAVKRRASRVFPLPGRAYGPWHLAFAQFFDWDEPPFFKHLLRVDVTGDQVTISCYPATGCVRHPGEPKPEDVVTCDLSDQRPPPPIT